MRLPHHLAVGPSGVFHFRLVVPSALHAYVGVRVIKRSLRTRDPSLAKLLAYSMSAGYAALFRELRGERPAMPTPPPLSEILRSLESGQARKFELERDKRTGIVTRAVSTDAEDRAALMEAIRLTSPTDAGSATAGPRPMRTGLTLHNAITVYKNTNAGAITEKREKALAAFEAHFKGDTPVSEIDRRMCAEWAASCITPTRTKRTVANLVSQVSDLWNHLIASGHVVANPVAGVIRYKRGEKKQRAKYSWQAFSNDQLKAIFKPENLAQATTEHVRWGALIGLYTGARVGEIAQIYLDDFLLDSEHPHVRLAAEFDEQTKKTDDSHRIVPIHPDLIRLGLLDRVARLRNEGEKLLFPSINLLAKAGPGSAISKGFSYLISEKLGFSPTRVEARIGFHSLRKNVIQQLQGHDALPGERRRALVGHQAEEGDVHARIYMRKWTAGELAPFEAGLTWGSWLDFEGLRQIL